MICMNCQKNEASETLHDGDMHVCSDCLPKYKSSIEESLRALESDRKQYQTIKWNGDFFNAESLSFVELKKQLNDSDYANAIADRRAWLQEHAFQLNNELLETNSRLAAVNQSLRDLAEKQREEIRAKLKEQDNKYQPAKPKIVKIPKLTSAKTSPFDRMVQSLAEQHGISFEAAKARIMGANLK